MKRAVGLCLLFIIIFIPNIALGNASCEHIFDEIIFLPDCTNEGYTVYSCNECSFEYISDRIPPYGHELIYSTLKEPTCTEYGVTDAVYCNVCGEVMKDWDEIMPLGHILTFVGEEKMTELMDYSCLRCGGIISRNSHEYLDNEIKRLLDKDILTYEYENISSALESIFNSLSLRDKGKVENKDILIKSIGIFELYRMGDIDLSGKICAEDISFILSAYGTDDEKSDINKSGTVNSDDLSLALSNYSLYLRNQ
ncbi:MAG: hypothetical protein IKM61_06085 [Eubacteriaceae bacterium]|nr:hypothetical protein [Eubacteriaceae bacterium]